ncbi:MAG: UDP-N-acetylmuramoyl-L-alanyl-D-glutamate--2,6-diaminopimelate ligase [Bacteroidales bacterium]|nr:UDP-N-acetylmuramoyl-L-alanyl-D-glutamate--2,6-diaminopimelate ligase [Bacteroidales bacterium]
MKLSYLIQELTVLELLGPGDQEINSVCFDSRQAAPSCLFVAQKGSRSDGHDFISEVVAKGAVAIVCENLPSEISPGVAYIRTDNSNVALGLISAAWFGHPSRKLKLVGVTGTNGKTTIASLLYNTFKAMGYKAGLLSTVCVRIDEQEMPATHTTPDAYAINSLLSQMLEAGCEYAFMEVSSHAAEQDRIAGLRFVGGIFTNLSHDHLDYHKTVEAYLKAKKSFFDRLPAEAFALSNADDKNGSVMLQNCRAARYTYSFRSLADFRARLLETHPDGMQLDFDGQEVHVRFIGKFNVSNLLAVYGAAILLGIDALEVLRIMSSLRPVSGRLEFMNSPLGFIAIVDYAHTPDALKNVLQTLAQIRKQGKIISVIGAGGNRDKTKRPEMALEAVRASDTLILTSDNPRFEEPQAILDDMYAGVPAEARKKVLCIVDRREAIRTAFRLAVKGDFVLVAGKGHEDYQEIKGQKYPFDDKKIIAEIFKELL